MREKPQTQILYFQNRSSVTKAKAWAAECGRPQGRSQLPAHPGTTAWQSGTVRLRRGQRKHPTKKSLPHPGQLMCVSLCLENNGRLQRMFPSLRYKLGWSPLAHLYLCPTRSPAKPPKLKHHSVLWMTTMTVSHEYEHLTEPCFLWMTNPIILRNK